MPQEADPPELPLLKKISVNVDRADYDWLKENLNEVKRHRLLPPGATVTDVINEGFSRRVAEIQDALEAAKKRKK